MLCAFFPHSMNPLYSFSIFEPLYALTIPGVLFIIFTLLMIGSLLMTPHARPEDIAKATLCYILKGFSLVLIGIGATPVIYMVLVGSLVPTEPLLGLAAIFLMGIGLFVHSNQVSHTIDAAAVAVPRAIFHVGCEALGLIISVVSGLALLVTFLVTKQLSGWAIPTTTLILGILLMTSFSLHTKPRRSNARPATPVAKRKA